jgi:cytochrome c oxidase assembly protein subunit 15
MPVHPSAPVTDPATIRLSVAEQAAMSEARVSSWLFLVAGLVVVMAAIGAATRLTGSGLSITEWEVVRGAIPPLSDAAWVTVFEKYKLIPQYARVNPGMTLSEFKVIYWWEWGHRLFGRLIGFAFVLPLAWFWLRGAIGHKRAVQLLAILALGGLQAFVGWFMVQSGLVDRVSVSPVRLAMHLTLAVLVFSLVLWMALETRRESLGQQAAPLDGGLWVGAVAILLLAFVQVVLGAFVAGLKAGLSYNTWPLMDGRLVPNGLGTLTPWALNLVENITTVQFNHRLMAYLLMAATLWHVVSTTRAKAPRAVIASARMLASMVVLQALLGIWTLLAVVPISLGIAHQIGAITVIATGVWHLHRVLRCA